MNTISDFKNKYSGERVFLIGNGPSLNKTPLAQLSDEYTIATNRINKIYDDTVWRPSFYIYPGNSISKEDKNSIRENADLGIPTFINSEHKNTVNIDKKNVRYLDIRRLDWHPAKKYTSANNVITSNIDDICSADLHDLFFENIDDYFYTYHTPLPCYQLAFYLGFSEIYLIGHDLGYDCTIEHMLFKNALQPASYSNSKKDFILDAAQNRVLLKSLANGFSLKLLQSDIVRSRIHKNHVVGGSEYFTNDYNNREFKYRDLDQHLKKVHQMAKKVTDKKGVDIYNATIGGELETFPRKDVKKLLSNTN